jgi:Skp family chaperone for outer membrane proteins
MKSIITTALVIAFAFTGTVFAQTEGAVSATTVMATTTPVVTSSSENAGMVIKAAEEQIKALRTELESKIKALKDEYKAKIDAIRKDAKIKVGSVRTQKKDAKMAGLQAMKQKREQMQTDIRMKREEIKNTRATVPQQSTTTPAVR